MDTPKKIRVLVVDDSIVFREVISRGISSDPGIEVIATARDAFEARDRILEYEPDVVTCDVEMPGMNGIEFVRRLMPQYPIPIVVVSSVSDAVFATMNSGAVDFVEKPDANSVEGVAAFIIELIKKVKIAVAANVSNTKNKNHYYGAAVDKDGRYAAEAGISADTGTDCRIIAVGASTGGTEAIHNILKYLPPSIPGIAIVQHIPPVFSRMFAERLNKSTQLRVKEAQDGDYIENGCVFVAAGDSHMRIKKTGGRFKIQVFRSERVSGHCPSVDVLFESVARECGSKAVGIILTGMGYDGAKGLLSMRRSGARTIGQDEESCVVYGMPKVAYNIGAVEKQVPLADIQRTLLFMLKKS